MEFTDAVALMYTTATGWLVFGIVVVWPLATLLGFEVYGTTFGRSYKPGKHTRIFEGIFFAPIVFAIMLPFILLAYGLAPFSLMALMATGDPTWLWGVGIGWMFFASRDGT